MAYCFIKVNCPMQNTKVNLGCWAKDCLIMNNQVMVLPLCNSCILNWVSSLIVRKKELPMLSQEKKTGHCNRGESSGAKETLASHRLVLFSQIINPYKVQVSRLFPRFLQGENS